MINHMLIHDYQHVLQHTYKVYFIGELVSISIEGIAVVVGSRPFHEQLFQYIKKQQL